MNGIRERLHTKIFEDELKEDIRSILCGEFEKNNTHLRGGFLYWPNNYRNNQF